MFNALKYSQELEKAGFSREQAETSMKVLIEVMNDNFATKSDMKELEVALKSDMKELEVALKSDMKELEVALKSDMKELEGALKSDMKELEITLRSDVKELDYRLTIKLGAMMTVAIGVTTTLIRILSLKA